MWCDRRWACFVVKCIRCCCCRRSVSCNRQQRSVSEKKAFVCWICVTSFWCCSLVSTTTTTPATLKCQGANVCRADGCCRLAADLFLSILLRKFTEWLCQQQTNWNWNYIEKFRIRIDFAGQQTANYIFAFIRMKNFHKTHRFPTIYTRARAHSHTHSSHERRTGHVCTEQNPNMEHRIDRFAIFIRQVPAS